MDPSHCKDFKKEGAAVYNNRPPTGRTAPRSLRHGQTMLFEQGCDTNLVSDTSGNLHTAFFHWTISRDKTYKGKKELSTSTSQRERSETSLPENAIVMTVVAPKSTGTKQRRYITAQPSAAKIKQAQNSANTNKVQAFANSAETSVKGSWNPGWRPLIYTMFQGIGGRLFARKFNGVNCSRAHCMALFKGQSTTKRTRLSDSQLRKNGYKEKEVGKVVLYSTTMGVVRKTYQDCVKVKKILRNMMVKYEERDVFMSREVQSEVRDRMNSDVILVPQMFVEGQHIGSCVQTSEPSFKQNPNIRASHIVLYKVMQIAQHMMSKKNFHHHNRAGTARATVLSLPDSPALLPNPSYVRMRTTVKTHVAGTVKRTVPYKDPDYCVKWILAIRVLVEKEGSPAVRRCAHYKEVYQATFPSRSFLEEKGQQPKGWFDVIFIAIRSWTCTQHFGWLVLTAPSVRKPMYKGSSGRGQALLKRRLRAEFSELLYGLLAPYLVPRVYPNLREVGEPRNFATSISCVDQINRKVPERPDSYNVVKTVTLPSKQPPVPIASEITCSQISTSIFGSEYDSEDEEEDNLI
uniref:Glutaredoxin domain-containing protein n=1 Tax=Timema monikensis TaxID=170555 RepID=A0A7R9E2M4_9NEOP|nr:unnamed protein product [Timema monikensis]